MELFYVTGNAGKFAEVKSFLEHYAPHISLQQVDIDLPEIQTLDHEAVAIDKAKKAYAYLQKPLLIDDAGIYFTAYHRFPGTLTKFVFEGIGLDGVFKLVQHDHRASFLLYLVYINGPESYHVFQQECYGMLVPPPPVIEHPKLPFKDIFVPIGTNKTFAQLQGTSEFETYNPRTNALKQFLAWYTK